MTESTPELTTPSKLARWKRPLIGGALSGFIAGIVWLSHIGGLFSGFTIPIYGYFFFVSILFWFFAGGVIAHFVTTNKSAMKHWLILYIASFVSGYIPWPLSVPAFILFLVFGILYYYKGYKIAKNVTIYAGIALIIVGLIVYGPILVYMALCIFGGGNDC